MNNLRVLSEFADNKDYAGLIERAIRFLIEDPDNLAYFDCIAFGYMEAGWRPLSLALYSYIKMKDSKFPGVDNNIARVKLDLGYEDESKLHEARKILMHVIKKTPDDPIPFNNLASYFIHEGNPGEGIKYAKESIRLAEIASTDPKHAQYNFGIASLMKRDWEPGWWGYDKGYDKRVVKKDYGVPEWDGTPGKKVIVVGEQGLGDELSFASMVPDLQKDCEVIFDAHPRLYDIIGRSFNCVVHPTRKKTEADWVKDSGADAWLRVGSLGAYYRKNDADFPREAFLKADPERKIQWRALLDSLNDKPKVGIAWSGGVRTTFQNRRSLSLKDIAPILEYDVEWISLQYKNTENMPPFIHHWPHGVESVNYDDTLALLDELDFIVTVQTTVAHAAGGLGKEVYCMIPNTPQWRYGIEGDDLPWYPNVRLLRQTKEGEWPIQGVCDILDEKGIGKAFRENINAPFVLEEL